MMQEGPREDLALKDILSNVLEESRMVLPGIQALFGFQLVAVFSTGFETLSSIDRHVHLVALFLTICSIGCLIAPASHHRQVEHDSVSRGFVNYASMLLCVGLIPLIMSTCLDVYVVTDMITKNTFESVAAAVAVFTLLTILWFVIPMAQKHRRDIEENTRATRERREFETAK